MASYFIKYRVESYQARDIYDKISTIIDFDKFEKVNSDSINQKIKEKIGCRNRKYEIDDIVKL